MVLLVDEVAAFVGQVDLVGPLPQDQSDDGCYGDRYGDDPRIMEECLLHGRIFVRQLPAPDYSDAESGAMHFLWWFAGKFWIARHNGHTRGNWFSSTVWFALRFWLPILFWLALTTWVASP